MRQVAYIVGRAQKPATLERILDMEDPVASLVFCRTRLEVESLVETCNAHGHRAEGLHGGMMQKQRDRVMGLFRAQKANLLIATDVAARGLDIEHISHVVNYDVPASPEVYLHRIGRTGTGRERRNGHYAGRAARAAAPPQHRERSRKAKLEIGRVPTVADLRARRLELTRASLRERLVAADYDDVRVVVESLADEFDPVDIAAAAVKMAHDALRRKRGARDRRRRSPRRPQSSPSTKRSSGRQRRAVVHRRRTSGRASGRAISWARSPARPACRRSSLGAIEIADKILVSGSPGGARRSDYRGAEGDQNSGKQSSRAQGEDILIDQRLKIAVFIDFDNIEIGVKTTLHTQFDIAAILDGIKERGEVVTKVAYGDWKRAGDYGRLMSQHAIRMVQRNLTPGGDKNGADINLALDALEMAFTHDHINAFVIVGGDSDFITLVEKLKQYDKKVFVVGGRQFTSQVMQKNCHEFIAYENLVQPEARAPGPGPRREISAAGSPADVAKAIPLVKRALKVLGDREVSPQLGLLKSTLLQLDSTFSERDYGVSTFRDFIEKVAKTGLVTLRHSGRSMMVDAVESPEGDGARRDAGRRPARRPRGRDLSAVETAAAAAGGSGRFGPCPSSPDQIQQIVEATRDVFGRAAQPPRWPMYVRQLKQFIRGVDQAFDERKWGFATVMEFLRVCQREGLFRLERDRRGQIRVFPGAALQRRR